MEIRNVTVDDYAAVDCLMQKLHKIHVLGRPDLFIDLEHPYSKEEFIEMIDKEIFLCLVAEEDRNVIGLCFVELRERSAMVKMRTAYVNDLIVDVNYRHKGIAKALFQEAEKRAKALGAKRLDLMLWAYNEEALHFYESLGMKPQRYILEKRL